MAMLMQNGRVHAHRGSRGRRGSRAPFDAVARNGLLRAGDGGRDWRGGVGDREADSVRLFGAARSVVVSLQVAAPVFDGRASVHLAQEAPVRRWLRGWFDDYRGIPLWPDRVVYLVAVIGLIGMVLWGVSASVIN